MGNAKNIFINSPIGKQEIDSKGSTVGVVRMDVDKSYAAVGKLLQNYINQSDQDSWDKIKAKIDYTFHHLDLALSPLKNETILDRELRSRLERGQKLLFKPNLVAVQNIDPITHGPCLTSPACTEWPFIAALMRWFHDKMNISYYQMALGEAATLMTAVAGFYSMIHTEGKTVTVEATIEGRSGDFYGGWGFYFARKYLSESLSSDTKDDPMKGYEESVMGTYIPPGHASDKLMIYDLNRIFDDPTKGREVEVPGGVNYKTITLHKVIIGGDPADPEDLKVYPGCILVNVPKFKVHILPLFTNIIKNLGIGLYPMQYAKTGGHEWDYSIPHKPIPGMKLGIPHQVWVPEIDFNTGFPKRDADGKNILNRTGGITATMTDIIKAVINQNIFMIHIVDGIETINRDHMGLEAGERVGEGLVFVGLDPVATDLLCARYMFSNVSLKKALEVGIDDGNGGYFPQEVPIPKIDGQNIISEKGYDCPLSRDICIKKAEERGLGQRAYYVVGHDAVTDSPIVSIQGHLGTIKDNWFSDLFTETLFYDLYKLPWDMQKTAFSYMEAVDKLEGTSVKKEFLDAFDENGDGIVTYEDSGKNGAATVMAYMMGEMISIMATDPFGYIKAEFNERVRIRYSEPLMNSHGHDIFKYLFLGTAIFTAYLMSQMEIESQDPFLSGLTWGKGKWPSLQLARFFQMGKLIYGEGFPNKVTSPSLYNAAFLYSDQTQNEGQYGGLQGIDRYFSSISSGIGKPLDFKLYVPAGYDNLSGNQVPNVEAASDPNLILTASFAGGKEIWPEVR
jgi:hypothetical protein